MRKHGFALDTMWFGLMVVVQAQMSLFFKGSYISHTLCLGRFLKYGKYIPYEKHPIIFSMCVFFIYFNLKPDQSVLLHNAAVNSMESHSGWFFLKNWLVQAKYKYYNIRLKCSTAPKYSLTEIRWCYFKGCSAFYLRVVDLLLVFRALKRCVEVQPSSPGRQGERNCFWMDKQQTRPIGCQFRHFSRCTCARVRSSPPPVNTRCFCANKEICHLTITCISIGFCEIFCIAVSLAEAINHIQTLRILKNISKKFCVYHMLKRKLQFCEWKKDIGFDESLKA